MRRTILISSIVVGTIALIGAGLAAYAYFNLSSLIARNQGRIVERVSRALGRQVSVGKIQAQVGWGVSVDVDGLTIADDPAFSSKPFLAASDVKVDVEFLPLLAGEARVSRLELSKPDIRLVMNANGDLNVSSIGANPGEAPQVKGEGRSRGKRNRRWQTCRLRRSASRTARSISTTSARRRRRFASII